MNKDISILYVDDEVLNLKVFEVNFKKKYTIFTARDGLRGLELLKEHPEIKIVISDMRMPHMDGLTFIRKAKALRPEIAFYILTGFDLTPEISEALKERVILNYFRKPFSMVKMDQVIQESIGK